MHCIMQLMLQALEKKSDVNAYHPPISGEATSLHEKREEARKYLAQRGINQPIGVRHDHRPAD